MVIGSTGNLGREVVEGLVAAGAAPRALSRRQGAPDGGVERVPEGVEAVPPDIARERMLADGRPPALVDALLAGAEARPASELITTTVEDLTGAPARTFARWAADRVDVFR
ncbi:hypothetical protein G3I50_09780 [Streptomyces parvus]|uniref:Uncharacterized protein n=1 Tax=Streptomyces parvus TaxID=66428 RepID=A0A7K3RTJ0_9ACTN|nr:hypothetical protein [Streptomyces parvus]